MRRFELHRDEDPTGVSGVGVVAEGVLFSSGKAVLEWLTPWPTSVVWHDRGEDSIRHIHGHDGRTRIVWLDGAASGEAWAVETQLLRSILRKLKASGAVEEYDTNQLWGRGDDENVVDLTPAEAALFDAIPTEKHT